MPAIFLPTLTFNEFIIFQIVHTSLNFSFLAIFLFVGINLLSTDEMPFLTKSILKNTGIIIAIDAIVILASNFFVFIGAIMLELGSFFFLFVDFILLFILFRERINWSKIRWIALYIITIIPTFVLSLFATEFIFLLAGIPNAVVLPFF